MFFHHKELIQPVKVDKPDAAFGTFLLEQFGGATGELTTARQYWVQSFHVENAAIRDMLQDNRDGRIQPSRNGRQADCAAYQARSIRRRSMTHPLFTLERTPVTGGRPVGTADFTDKVIEMTETSEQAVVSKTAHVVEEVNLRKNVTDRVETVNETLRRDEVEIEKVPGESISTHAAGPTPVMPASSPKN
jgi:hypothetical protein